MVLFLGCTPAIKKNMPFCPVVFFEIVCIMMIPLVLVKPWWVHGGAMIPVVEILCSIIEADP